MKTKIRLFVLFAFFVCSLIFSACKFNSENQTVKYTVSHYLQNIEDDDFVFYESEDFSGTSGESAVVQLKNYAGFTALPVEDSKISNGKNIIVKYSRNFITCTLNFNGGTVILADGSEQSYDVISGKYGAKIVKPVPLKKGYVLEDWTDSNGNVLGDIFLSSGTFTASYVEKSTSSYTVHHFYQNVEDDDYTENISEKEILEGRAGTKTNTVAKNVEGFNAKNIEQAVIQADESTEVNVYYDRKLITFSFNLVGGQGETFITKKYGTLVSSAIVKEPVKESSTFAGWNPELPDAFTENQNFTAVWDVPYYTVKYLFENLDDSGYSEDENFPAEKHYGTKGELTDARGKVIPGFVAQNISQAVIKEDNSTIVLVKYDRKLITLYINLNGGAGTSYIQGKYGQSNEVVLEKLGLLNQPVRAGFSLDENKIYTVDPPTLDFSLENDETTPISVNWVGGAAATYVAVILKERADYTSAEDRYDIYKKLIVKGYSGSQTEMEVNKENNSVSIGEETFNFPYFIPEENKNIQIAGDESTVLNIYFNRKIINITYDLNGGNIDGNTNPVVISGRYESAFNTELIPQNLLQEGCESYEWDSSYSKFPAEDKVVKAKWIGKPYTVTFHLEDREEQKEYRYIEEYFVPDLVTLTGLSLADGGVSGWKLSSDSQEITYACGEKFTLPSPADLHLYANIETNYVTVRYFQQNVSDDNYTELSETTKVYAVPGSVTRVVAKEFEGFHVLDFEQKKVEDSNQTVLDIYYDRNIYTLHFNLDGGYAEIPKKENNKYVRVTEIPDVECRYGSTFKTTDYRPYKFGYFYNKLCWNNDNGKTVSNFNSSNFGFTIENICSDMNLTLSGEQVTYKLTLYNKNNAKDSNDLSVQDTYTITADTEDMSLPELKLSGYEFSGWYTDYALSKSCTASSFKEYVISETDITYGESIVSKKLYAKWTKSTLPDLTTEVRSVGDIILSDGKVLNTISSGGKPTIDGFVWTLTDDLKNKAIGVVTHKVNGTWRFVGKNHTPTSGVKMGKHQLKDRYQVPEENDGLNALSIFKEVKDNDTVWNFIFNYGDNNNLTKFNNNWYLPALNELKAMGEYIDYISATFCSIGSKAISKSTYYSCKYDAWNGTLGSTAYDYGYDFSSQENYYVNVGGSSANTLPCHEFN